MRHRPLAWLLALLLLASILIFHASTRFTSAQEKTVGETPESLNKKAAAVLAQLEGEIRLPGLKEPVEVLRDRWGVPHIYAKNSGDLFFAQGFIVAQDRLFQIDVWRRIALGETAAVVGKAGLEADRFARLVKYRGDMDAEWTSYSPDTKEIATAFTRGINACIDHMGDRLPVEFQLLSIKPARWQPGDCLGRMSGIIMSRNFQSELARAELVAAVGIDKARRIAPTDPPRAFAPAPGLDLGGIDRSILAGFNAAIKPLAFSLPMNSTDTEEGSNNWAVDGSLSVSGKPLLASDPHRVTALPSLRYLVHLNAPGWNVIGSGEPALPGVAIGHNEHVAWGFTIVGTDQADIFVEDTNPENATEYRVGDAWEPMKIVREQVTVRGMAKPLELELRFTRHGPVIHDDAKRHRAFALKWAGSEPGGAAYLPSLALDRTKNACEFVAALAAWKLPSLNMVHADVDGNIGWVAAALTPVRKGSDGLLPVPGARGQYDWQGFLPRKELPQAHNPANHWVATANHNILPPGYRHEIGYEWAAPYRFARIKERLEVKKKFTLEDFQSIQHDNTSLAARALIRLLRNSGTGDAKLRPFVLELSAWDGVLAADSVAGALYGLWLQELLGEFYRPHVPAGLVDFVRAQGGVPTMLAALEKPDTAWFGEKPVEGRDRLLLSAFEKAVARRNQLPGNTQDWPWGRLHTTTFRHPLALLGPAHAKAFNLGPVRRAGDGHTPNAASHSPNFEHISGATYRHIFDLADWDRGLATSAPGQSGQPGSPHYGDLLRLWDKGEYFPLAYSRARVEEVTRHRLKLVPLEK